MSRVVVKTKIILKNGKPSAVILDIKKYETLLEAVEDRKEIEELRHLKKIKTSFRLLEDYMKT